MLNNIITKRKSIRDFNSTELDEEVITTLFEAARRAPSAFNEQPWRFIVADRKDKKEFNSMLDVLFEKNREWAKNASLLVIALSKKTLTKINQLNRHYMYDTASAVANLTFQASSLDLYVHQMGGFNAEKIVDKYAVPVEYEPAVILAIGRKIFQDVEPAASQLEINRMPLNKILFKNRFDDPYPILLNQNAMNN